ncbi:hypothetical protein QWZ08_01970 [Ferruginibacter paludis]|uniref:hypothetical protein n=1 Tax=Ferruginibacter paludis TaxID=1310417 RepID=UPI0025B39351|nr:hypothetical protein [Ferruginibacter paludis]MDN3654373.1 hypothetical protein [Ferruginibacter paludis]
MKFSITLFLLTWFFLQFSACKKACNEPDYSFLIKTSFSSEKDSIPLGDTLWLKCETPSKMQDLNTKSQINFVGAVNLGTSLIVQDIKKFLSNDRGAVDSFDFIKVDGEIYSIQTLSPERVKQLSFFESNNNYKFKIGIVAKKKGLYVFTITDIPNVVYRKGMEQCGKASFEILNVNEDKHLYLIENIVGALSEYDRKHSYCFKVF